MKAFILILFSAFYLLFSIGLNVNLHYCGGKLKTVSLFSTNEKGCCGSKMKSKGCCDNKTIILKVKDKQQLNKIAKVSLCKAISIPFIKIPEICFTSFYVNRIEIPENYHSPPIRYKTPLFLRNKVLII